MSINEADDWTTAGAKINTPQNLAGVRRTLQEIGPIIVEHWLYRGARAPDRIVFDEFEDYEKYLNSNVRPGDNLYIWSFAEVCTNENALAYGKYPDDQGRVPTKGAY
jgi:hypothetical protein